MVTDSAPEVIRTIVELLGPSGFYATLVLIIIALYGWTAIRSWRARPKPAPVKAVTGSADEKLFLIQDIRDPLLQRVDDVHTAVMENQTAAKELQGAVSTLLELVKSGSLGGNRQ